MQAPTLTAEPAAPTPLPMQWLRWLRVSAHIGVAVMLAGCVFPLVAVARRAQLVKWWSAKLLRILNIGLQVAGRRPHEHARNTIIVANHISWLDIFVINAAHPARFVAKSEVRSWPVVGWLCAKAGTIFIERGRRRDTARIAAIMHDALQGGDTLGLFPEGTTTSGDHLLKFNSSLFEPAIANHVHLAPVALRYRTPDGERCDAVAFIGDLSFMASMQLIIGQRSMGAELLFAPRIETDDLNRRELAQRTEIAIAAQLGIALPKARQRFDAQDPEGS